MQDTGGRREKRSMKHRVQIRTALPSFIWVGPRVLSPWEMGFLGDEGNFSHDDPVVAREQR